MKESNVRDFKSGESFTANIDGRIVSGKIQIHNNKLYLCQNEKSGASTSDRLGFKYSWIASHESGVLNDETLAYYDVKDLVIGTPVTGMSYVISIDFKDVANKTSFIGTFRGREVKGIFYTSRKDGVLYILSNEPSLYGNRGAYTYGYHYSFAIHSIGDKILFPSGLHLNFSSKGSSAVNSGVSTITAIAIASVPPTIDPKKIATGTPFTGSIQGAEVEGVFYNYRNERLYFLYNGGPLYNQSYTTMGYSRSYSLRERNSMGMIETKNSLYQIKSIGEATPEMKRLHEIESRLPKEAGGYAIARSGNEYIFGCGEVKLTYEEIVSYVKVKNAISNKISRTYASGIDEVAARLADPGMKEVIEKIK